MIDFLVHSIMIPMLKFFHDQTGSYGWAIILLTVAVKSALLPLTYQSLKSSLEMQKIQPKLKILQERYKDRPEMLNKKLMEFYKENRVNPLGGCLPILFQLPIFIGLYSTFTSKEFIDLAQSGNSSFLFIQDLTRSGMYSYDNIVLLVLFASTTFISQKLMITNPNDPMQKQMLYMMPIMITIMFAMVPVPSGAMLYVVVSNIITMIQNLYVVNKRKAAEAVGNDSVESFVKKLDESDKNDPKQKSKSPIALDKKSILGDNQMEMSTTLATASKSQRANKKQKKNRKK